MNCACIGLHRGVVLFAVLLTGGSTLLTARNSAAQSPNSPHCQMSCPAL